MKENIKQTSEFLLQFKNKDIEIEEIVLMKNSISDFALKIRQNEYFNEIYDNYLLIKGYSYRLDNTKQRLYYTFKEAIYALDLSNLQKDEIGIKLNTSVYIVVLDDCINEYLGYSTNRDEELKAKEYYRKIEDKKAKENQKYHMYQQ